MPTEAPAWEETEEVSAPNWADTQALESPIPSPLEFQGPPLPPPSPPPATMRTAGLRERLGLGPLGDILGVGRGVQRELQREAGGGVPTPKELVDVGFQFTTVPPQLAKPIEKITDVPINLLPPTAAGAVQGVRDIVLQVPWAAGVVGMGKRAGDLLYGAFLADFLLQVPQAYEQYKALRAQGRNQEAARLAVSQVGTGLLMGAGLKRHQEIRAGGRVDPERAKLANDILELDAAVPGTLDAAKGLIQRQAPETQRQAPAVPVVPVAPPKREETPVAPVAPAEPTAAAQAVAAAGQVPEAAAAVIPEARALPAQAAAEASARAAEISKPAWVINLEAVEKAGNLNEGQAKRLAKWRAEQPAAPAAQPKEANAVAPRIEQESREPEHPGVAQRPAVSPDQPEVRQVEGGQAGGGNRPVGEPKKEGEVLLTRDWDLFSENLADDLESFADTRGTGKRDYDMQDVADRFVDYAKQDKSGKPLDELVSDFAKSDEASQGQIRKLRQSVKSVMASETPKAPVAETAGERGRLGAQQLLERYSSDLADVKRRLQSRKGVSQGTRDVLTQDRIRLEGIIRQLRGAIDRNEDLSIYANDYIPPEKQVAEPPPEPPAPKPKEAIPDVDIREGDTIQWVPDENRAKRYGEIPVQGIVQDVIHNPEGDIGFNIFSPTKEDPTNVVRVWANRGKVVSREPATVEGKLPGVREAETVRETRTPARPKTVVEIADEIAAKGIEPSASYGQFVKARNLKPEIDAKEWIPIYRRSLELARLKKLAESQKAAQPTTPAEGVGKGVSTGLHFVKSKADLDRILTEGFKPGQGMGQYVSFYHEGQRPRDFGIGRKHAVVIEFETSKGGSKKYEGGIDKTNIKSVREATPEEIRNWGKKPSEGMPGVPSKGTTEPVLVPSDATVKQSPPAATEGGGQVPPTGPGIGAGPGAAGAGWADVAMQRLKEGIEALPKSDAKQKLAWADRWADMEGRGRDLADRMTLKMAAVNASVRDSMRGVRSPTELGRKVGELDYLLQRSSAISHNTAEAMRKQMPSEDVRAGLWLYADAHGDLNAIRDTIATMPADTPANVKRALNAALNLTPKEKAWLPLIRDYYDRRADEGLATGVLNSVLEDYWTHVWRVKDNMPTAIQAALNRGAISEVFQFAREQKLSTMLEGIKNPGMIPGKRLEPVLDAAKVMPFYNYAMDRAIASRAFIASLKDMTASDGRPLVAPTGVGVPVTKHQWAVVNDATGKADPFVKGVFDTEAEAIAALAGRTGYHVEPRADELLFIKPKVRPQDINGYEPIDHPAMRKWQWASTDAGGKTVLYEGELLAHPEIFPRLANMMDRSRLTPSAVTKAALKYSGELKAAKLGMLSTFHLLHVGKHAIFHWTNPFAAAVRNPIDWESPQVRFAVEQGHLKLAPEPGEINALSEGLGAAGNMLIHKVPVLGPISRAFSEWMFREYIPRLKLHTFENALQRNMAMYGPGRSTLGKVTAFGAKALTPEEIAARTGDAVNAAYGELNKYWLGKFGRDPRLQRALRLGFLAPDFGEARLRFVGKAFTKYGNEERMALFLNAALVYTAARIGNYLSTGDPQMDDPRHAFEVKVGDHWVGMRSVIADLAHAMSNFSQFMRVRLNPGLAEPLIEMLSRTNARGQPVDAMGQVKDMLRRTVPITFQGLTESDRHVWESFSSSMGLMQRRGDAVSSVHELARKWKKDRGIESPVVIHESPVGNPYREARVALEMDDEPRFWRQVQEQYRRLRLNKTEHPAKVIEQAFTRYYGMPFTGKKELEKSFLAEMEPRNRVVYQQAVQQRKDELKKFKTWWKNHEAAFAGQ